MPSIDEEHNRKWNIKAAARRVNSVRNGRVNRRKQTEKANGGGDGGELRADARALSLTSFAVRILPAVEVAAVAALVDCTKRPSRARTKGGEQTISEISQTTHSQLVAIAGDRFLGYMSGFVMAR